MKSTAIIDLMVRDHAKIVGLINKVEKAIHENHTEKMQVFHEMEWMLEKHLFTEEKAMFTFYDPEFVTEGYKMLPQLIQEHNDITNRLVVMKKNLRNNTAVDFQGLKSLLLRHKQFEEEQVYPRLDQELSEEQKHIIMNRMKELV